MGSGGSPPKTGVSIIDDTAEQVDKEVSNLTRGASNITREIDGFTRRTLGNTGSLLANPIGGNWDLTELIGDAKDMVSMLSNNFNAATSGITKNVERSARNSLQGAALLASGKWNNADRTLLDIALMSPAGGHGMVNPDDVTQRTGKETSVERLTAEKTAEAERQVQELAEAERARAVGAVNSTISGIIGAQRRSPGRAMTLVGDSGLSNYTLLTSGR